MMADPEEVGRKVAPEIGSHRLVVTPVWTECLGVFSAQVLRGAMGCAAGKVLRVYGWSSSALPEERHSLVVMPTCRSHLWNAARRLVVLETERLGVGLVARTTPIGGGRSSGAITTLSASCFQRQL